VILRERNLFPPLRLWLNKRGYRVYSEVCLSHRPTDVVAVLDEIQVGFELKMNCSHHVISQAHNADLFLNAAYVVFPTKPLKKKIESCINLGLGMIRIDGSEVIEILKPKYHDPVFNKKFDFTNWDEGLDAGTPNMKGIGPAKQCLVDIKKYITIHPNAKWAEIFANVRTHYSSPASLQNSMGIWQGFTLPRLKK
jgi:hypothetical protein